MILKGKLFENYDQKEARLKQWHCKFLWWPTDVNGECLWLENVYRRAIHVSWSPVGGVLYVWEYAKTTPRSTAEPKKTKTRKFSFDDNSIGHTIDNHKLINRIIDRPTGFPRGEWYKFAGQVCKLLNRETNK